MQPFRGRLLQTSVLAMILTASAIGLANAAIPNSITKVYVGCLNSLGAVRLIDHQAGKRCKSTERTISWNQRGQSGPVGAPGADGVSGREIVTEDFVMSVDAMSGTSIVECPDGKVPVGGGYDYGKGFDRPRGQYGAVFMDASYPTETGWAVQWYHETAQNLEVPFTAYAVCAMAS
jgi:hypothetical protein